MGLFDNLQSIAQDTVALVMGYGATWAPAAGGSPLTAQVLYKGPTEAQKLLQATYDPDALTLEYKAGNFSGLFEAVEANQQAELITITGIGQFYVQSVRRKFDGKTIEATLAAKVD